MSKQRMNGNQNKAGLIVLSLSVLFVFLFVSCDGEKIPQTVDAPLTFVTFEGVPSKDRSITYSHASYSSLYWFYTATKTDDGYGIYGQTETQTPVTVTTSSSDSTPAKGLDSNSIGPFSQGEWTFQLFAYECSGDSYDENSKVQIYESDEVKETLYSGETKTVTVGVKSVEKGNGTLSLKGLYFTCAESITSVVMTLTGTDSNNKQSYTFTINSTDESTKLTNTDETYTLPTKTDSITSGTYTCVVKAYKEDETTTPSFTSTFKFALYTGATTTLSGAMTADEEGGN